MLVCEWPLVSREREDWESSKLRRITSSQASKQTEILRLVREQPRTPSFNKQLTLAYNTVSLLLPIARVCRQNVQKMCNLDRQPQP